MKKRYALLALLLLITSQASAEQYAIHLDTSEASAHGNYEALSIYGKVYTVTATQGYITTLIGPYEGKQLAGETLNKIRADGYYGAYITKHKKVRSKIPHAGSYRYSEMLRLKTLLAAK